MSDCSSCGLGVMGVRVVAVDNGAVPKHGQARVYLEDKPVHRLADPVCCHLHAFEGKMKGLYAYAIELKFEQGNPSTPKMTSASPRVVGQAPPSRHPPVPAHASSQLSPCKPAVHTKQEALGSATSIRALVERE